jgi:hypothetical protein
MPKEKSSSRGGCAAAVSRTLDARGHLLEARRLLGLTRRWGLPEFGEVLRRFGRDPFAHRIEMRGAHAVETADLNRRAAKPVDGPFSPG